MRDAVARVRTGEVTQAVRDCERGVRADRGGRLDRDRRRDGIRAVAKTAVDAAIGSSNDSSTTTASW